jgi:hypothetical protein
MNRVHSVSHLHSIHLWIENIFVSSKAGGGGGWYKARCCWIEEYMTVAYTYIGF